MSARSNPAFPTSNHHDVPRFKEVTYDKTRHRSGAAQVEPVVKRDVGCPDALGARHGLPGPRGHGLVEHPPDVSPSHQIVGMPNGRTAPGSEYVVARLPVRCGNDRRVGRAGQDAIDGRRGRCKGKNGDCNGKTGYWHGSGITVGSSSDEAVSCRRAVSSLIRQAGTRVPTARQYTTSQSPCGTPGFDRGYRERKTVKSSKPSTGSRRLTCNMRPYSAAIWTVGRRRVAGMRDVQLPD